MNSKWLVTFETMISRTKRSSKTVKATSKDEAFKKARRAVCGNRKEPSFEITSLIGIPGKYNVLYKMDVYEKSTSTIEVLAESEQSAIKKALRKRQRSGVFPTSVDPRSVKAVNMEARD